MLVPPELSEDHPLLSAAETFVNITSKRRDVWSSFDHVRTSLQSKSGFQAWDKQVLDIYLVTLYPYFAIASF